MKQNEENTQETMKCSEEFKEIVNTQLKKAKEDRDLEQFVKELEAYAERSKMNDFEKDTLEEAKKTLHLCMVSSSPLLGGEDSTEKTIRQNEMDYNGDMFESMGYEFRTDDGRRY